LNKKIISVNFNKFVLMGEKLASLQNDQMAALKAFDQIVKESIDQRTNVRNFELLDLMKYASPDAQTQVCLLYYRYFTAGLNEVNDIELDDVYSSYKGTLDSIEKAVGTLNPTLLKALIKETKNIDSRVNTGQLFKPFRIEASYAGTNTASKDPFEAKMSKVIQKEYTAIP